MPRLGSSKTTHYVLGDHSDWLLWVREGAGRMVNMAFHVDNPFAYDAAVDTDHVMLLTPTYHSSLAMFGWDWRPWDRSKIHPPTGITIYDWNGVLLQRFATEWPRCVITAFSTELLGEGVAAAEHHELMEQAMATAPDALRRLRARYLARPQ